MGQLKYIKLLRIYHNICTFSDGKCREDFVLKPPKSYPEQLLSIYYIYTYIMQTNHVNCV